MLTVSGGKNTSIGGVISGTGGLTKSGTGTLTLTGANSYSGATSLNAGVVALGSDSALGSGAVTFAGAQISSSGGSRTLTNAITVSSATTFTAPNDLTFNGAVGMTASRTFTVSGAGIITLGGTVTQSTGGSRKLTKSGAGTLVLNGANTFGGGGVVLSAGTLILGNDTAVGTGKLSLGSATLQAGGGARTLGNAVSLTGNAVFAGANDLTFTSTAALTASRTLTVNNSAVTFSGVMSGAGFALTKDGAGTLTLSGTAANTFSGSTIVNDGKLVLAKSTGVNAFGGTVLTIGNGTGAANSAVVQLNAADQMPNTASITLKADGQLNLQTFTDTIAALTTTGGSIIGTGRLDLGGDVTASATGTAVTTISANLGLNASRTFAVNDNSALGDSDLAISGVISNGGATSKLTKTGAGTLALSGANIFSGGADVNNGTVLLDASSAGAITSGPLGTAAVNVGDISGTSSASVLFSATAGRTVANALTIRTGSTGNVLTLGGLNASGVNTFSGTVTLSRDAVLTAATGGEVDFNGVVSGVGFGITKTGGGTIKLGVANSFTGLTTVSAGTLSYGVNDALATGGVTVNGGTLDLGASHTDTVGAVILDNGGSILGSGSSALTSTAAFDVRSGAVSAILAGSVGLNKTTAGSVTLSGANTFSGATAISVGTLRLGAANGISVASAVTVASGAILDLNSFADTIGSLAGAGGVTLGSAILTAGGDNTSTTFSGVISGAGGLTKAGTGILTLSGLNTYTGATTISAGTLKLGAADVIADVSPVSVSVAAGATFDLNNFSETIGSLGGAGSVKLGSATLTAGGDNSTTSFSGVVSGTGALIKTGAGMMTLTGGNTLSGAVTLGGGTLVLSGTAGTAASTSGFSLNNGTTLTLDNSAGENTNRIGNSAAITFGGATLRFISDANGSTETVGALNATGGGSAITVVHNGLATDSTSLTFSSLGTITAGASVNFSATGGTLGASAAGPHIYILGQATGYLGGWATVGSDFAEYYTDGVRAFSSYHLGSDGINVNDALKIPLLSASSPASAYTLTRAGTTTDLGLSLTDLATVDLGSATTRTLNLAGGGLIKSTTTATTISGLGRLTAGGTANGTLNVSVGTGNTLTVSSIIINNAGANGLFGDGDDGVVSLSKGDAGLLVLSGASSYTGNNFLNGGTVRIAAENNLGDVANDVSFGGGTLNVTAGFAAGTGKLFSVNADLSGTFDIAAAQTLTLGNVGNVLTTGNVAGVLFKAGAGALVIQSANAGFDGTVQINAGVVELRNGQALGDAVNRGRITLNGGTLNLRGDAGTSFANDLSLTADSTIDVNRLTGTSPAVAHSLGGLSIGANILTITGGNGASLAFGAVALTGNATFNPTTAGASVGAVSGGFGFSKTGAATLVLNGAGTNTGATTISVGTLQLATANGVSAASALTVASGATFDLNGLADTIGSLAGAGSVQLGSGTLTTGASNASTSFSGAISGSGGLTKTGTGTFTLTAANSFTGTTTVGAGTLQFGAVNALNSASAITAAAGATLDLNNFNESIGSLTGAGNIALGSGTLSSGANNSSTTFSGAMSGAGNFTKLGSGTLTLSGTSNHAGLTTIGAGVVVLQNSAALGSATGATVVGAGGELQLASGLAVALEPLTLNGSGTTGSGALRLVSGSASWAGPITLASASTVGADGGSLTLAGSIDTAGGALTFTGAGGSQVDGVISGSGGLVKNGAGSLTLTAANTFSGAATINAGSVSLQNTAALGATGAANGTTVASGAAILLNDASGIGIGGETLTVSGSGGSGAGVLESIAGNNSWAGNIVLAANSTIGVDAASLTLFAAISESGGARTFTKTGAGVLILAGDNSYTGATLITAGTLQLGNAERIADVSVVVVSTGATLDLADSSETIGSLSGAGNVTLGATLGTTLTTGGNAASTTFSGAISGTGDLVKTGAGTMSLSGATTAIGATTIAAGTLQFAKQAALYNNDATSWTPANISVASGAALALNVGGTGEFTTTNLTTLLDATHLGGSTATTGLQSGATLGLDTTNATGGTFTPAAAITNPSAGANALSLTKLGSGILSLTATNTFTGTTTVAVGTLSVTGSIANSTALVVNNSGTLLLGAASAVSASASVALGGTLKIADSLGANTAAMTESLGALTLSADSTIDFGTSAGGGVKLLFSSLGAHTPGSGPDLAIVNWNGTNQLGTNATDRLIFTGAATDFTNAFAQADISFNGATGYSAIQFGGSYEIVPVPEPATWLAGAALLGLAGFRGWHGRRMK